MSWFALVRKKEKWVTTLFGKLLKLIFLLLILFVFTFRIHPFLAQHKPVAANIMVVEGFIPDYALKESMSIFYEGNYELMIITGKKRMKGSQLDQYANDGLYAQATLVKLGFDSLKIKVIKLENDVKKDRTYASAKSVEQWVIQSGRSIDKLNLVSISCHARRSRLIFEKAFGENTEIGIMAIYNISYNPKRWWKSSSGFREVIEETIAWVYARFFFYPDD